MTRTLMAATIAMLLGCGSGHAQVGGMAAPGPNFGMGSTSPLGMSPSGSSVAPTGIPMGATELATPGVSPGSFGLGASTFGAGTTCLGSTSTGMGTAMIGTPGSSGLFDAGGVSTGIGATQPGTSGTGALSTSTCSQAPAVGSAVSSQPTTSSTAGTSRLGIPSVPMGSTELGNLGVSPAPCPATGFASPTPGVASPFRAC